MHNGARIGATLAKEDRKNQKNDKRGGATDVDGDEYGEDDEDAVFDIVERPASSADDASDHRLRPGAPAAARDGPQGLKLHRDTNDYMPRPTAIPSFDVGLFGTSVGQAGAPHEALRQAANPPRMLRVVAEPPALHRLAVGGGTHSAGAEMLTTLVSEGVPHPASRAARVFLLYGLNSPVCRSDYEVLMNAAALSLLEENRLLISWGNGRWPPGTPLPALPPMRGLVYQAPPWD